MGLVLRKLCKVSLQASKAFCAFSLEAVTVTKNHPPISRSKPVKEKLASYVNCLRSRTLLKRRRLKISDSSSNAILAKSGCFRRLVSYSDARLSFSKMISETVFPSARYPQAFGAEPETYATARGSESGSSNSTNLPGSGRLGTLLTAAPLTSAGSSSTKNSLFDSAGIVPIYLYTISITSATSKSPEIEISRFPGDICDITAFLASSKVMAFTSSTSIERNLSSSAVMASIIFSVLRFSRFFNMLS
mmetsp:Transcript_38291/g.92637  ORF Transcript_38291/g.92637 Transcript_38291/m.92637 type:complete len:247 (+) Transcript_38291:1056-1796(+)